VRWNWSLVVAFICSTGILSVNGQVSGVVFHEYGEPMPNALVLILPDSISTVTDIGGEFSFTNLSAGDYQIVVTYVAHLPQIQSFKYGKEPLEFRFSLSYDTERLSEVIIEGEHGYTEDILGSVHVGEGFVEMETKSALAQTLDRLAGISSINVGVGVSKPVIRGLSNNRIIVLTDNIKQEGQQWGTDHGLEIDQYDAEEIEILKGPASLQYGSDGLGGVINILPEKIPAKGTINGVVLGNFRSNNMHGGGSARLNVNLNNVFGSLRYSHQQFGDYSVPADSFIYNTFVLPINNRLLKNTAGTERNISGYAGILRVWGLTRIDVSHYSLDVGLFSGAIGVPRSYALTDDGNNRNIDEPRQSVRHLKAVISQEFFLRTHQVLHLHFGYQENLRREFSFPEFHSVPSVDPNNTLAIELRLKTFTANGHLDYEFNYKLSNTYGFDAQYQINERDGFELFIPNFKTVRTGLYVISNWQPAENLLVQGGLRADYGKNLSDFSQRYVYSGTNTIVDSLETPETNDDFFNVSGSLGLNRKLGKKGELRANLGKSFRVPYLNETTSNGVHHGTFRHEVGNPDLKSEHGYQFDLSTDWKWSKVYFNVAGYFNFFQDYIYLSPSARFSLLPEAGQLFEYKQHNVFYTGGELNWGYSPWKFMEVSQAYEYVWNYNLETGLALPFTPPGSVLSEIMLKSDKIWLLENAYLFVNNHFVLAQNRVDRNEPETPAYNLINLGFGFDIKLTDKTRFGSSLKIRFSVQNILNQRYLNHLSRYRWINVPEQGRNLVVSVKIPFTSYLKD
jgi:iron complex outermembrane receptor protein